MLNIREIIPELMIKARDELNEVQERIPEDIAKIRDWIEKQPHLTARTDDQFLLSFLRGCKYSLEKTKSKIDAYYTIKTLSPEIFTSKSIDEKTMRLLKLGAFLPLQEPLEIDGPRIHITRFGIINYEEYSLKDLFQIEHRILDIQLLEDDNVFIGGFMNIIDMSSMSLATILKLDFVLLHKMVIYAENAAPFRIKGIHLINICKEALYIAQAFQSIVPNNVKNRIIIHSSMESLYEYIPKKYLPKEYGGENESLKNTIDHWENLIIRYNEFFEEGVKYGVNEKLRIGEKKTMESIFGLQGSFRKLEVD